MQFLTFLAARFVAGNHRDDAINVAKKLNSNGISVTLDFLGEDTTRRDQALVSKEEYIHLLEAISKNHIIGNVSLKLTQLGLDIDSEFCMANMEEILQTADKHENFVRIDMEGTKHTTITLSLFNRLFEKHKNVGPVIQAYLKRSLDDLKDMVPLLPSVRLCKGAYKEPPDLAFQTRKEVVQNYKNLSDFMLSNGFYPGFATHDSELIDYVKSLGIAKDKFEFQMLYGLRRKLALRLAKEGYRVRIYIPYGTHWFGYFTRRLRERKENIGFLLSNLFKD